MANLKNSKVFRSGVTAKYFNYETKSIQTCVNRSDAALQIDFKMASKGGGTTEVSLRIGGDDLPAILEDVASKMPDRVGMFSDCAAIANKKNLEELNKALKVKDDEKARAKMILNDLEAVEGFVSEKYNELPVGEDERESEIKDKIESVIAMLRKLH